ncbi:hypothetical protein [Nannocystis pusilla]|uniref:hypothetical protein n=1 Tax=Nannocystis pusilla TaxID=889268 RepID=UPI003B815FB9
MVAIAAILATLAVREHAAIKRHERHTEAVTVMGELFNATAAYYHERRPSFTDDGAEAPTAARTRRARPRAVKQVSLRTSTSSAATPPAAPAHLARRTSPAPTR